MLSNYYLHFNFKLQEQINYTTTTVSYNLLATNREGAGC